MRQYSDVIYLRMILIVKLLASVLIWLFPEALFRLFPLGICSPFVVGAMGYSGISKDLYFLVVILMIVLTISLVGFSICIIGRPKCAIYFAYVLMICYAFEGICCVLSMVSGDIVFISLLGIAFNAITIKLLWRAKNKR